MIVYHKGLNCKPMVYLDCVVENNYFTGEREISESLCSCDFITFKNAVQKGIPGLHLASPQGLYSGKPPL